MNIKIPQPTKKGYIELPPGSVFDAAYPGSKTRRGRVQGGGGRYAQHYNAAANHYCMKELKIEHIEKPKGISNSPYHIIPYLPMGGYSSIADIGHTATPTIYYLLQLQHEFQQIINNFLKLWTTKSICPKN